MGGPLERLGGFVDYFLQPGMKQLPSFIQDTKHTLQMIEEINQKIDDHEVSMDGVIVTLDVEAMYNNMNWQGLSVVNFSMGGGVVTKKV